MKPQPLIAVRDVEASSRWYQDLLGCTSGHGGAEYEQLVDPAGTLILQLHAWGAHEHPHMGDPAIRPHGNGVLLWFQIDDFDAAVGRARDKAVEILLSRPDVADDDVRALAAWPEPAHPRSGTRRRNRSCGRRHDHARPGKTARGLPLARYSRQQ